MARGTNAQSDPAQPAGDPAAQPAATADPSAPAADPAPVAQPQPAVVEQQRYTGEGWEVGQYAPKDRFQEIDAQGNPIGKVLDAAPKGKYGTQIAVKGAVVTHATRRALGLDK